MDIITFHLNSPTWYIRRHISACLAFSLFSHNQQQRPQEGPTVSSQMQACNSAAGASSAFPIQVSTDTCHLAANWATSHQLLPGV